MLTLASNNITDLNEMSHLVHLTNLREFTIMNNPCVNMTGNCMYPYCVLVKRNMKYDIKLLVYLVMGKHKFWVPVLRRT